MYFFCVCNHMENLEIGCKVSRYDKWLVNMLQLSSNEFLFLPMLITTQRTALMWKGNKYRHLFIVIKLSQILHFMASLHCHQTFTNITFLAFLHCHQTFTDITFLTSLHCHQTFTNITFFGLFALSSNFHRYYIFLASLHCHQTFRDI